MPIPSTLASHNAARCRVPSIFRFQSHFFESGLPLYPDYRYARPHLIYGVRVVVRAILLSNSPMMCLQDGIINIFLRVPAMPELLQCCFPTILQ
jgi:hypothetical protein